MVDEGRCVSPLPLQATFVPSKTPDQFWPAGQFSHETTMTAITVTVLTVTVTAVIYWLNHYVAPAQPILRLHNLHVGLSREGKLYAVNYHANAWHGLCPSKFMPTTVSYM